MRAAVEREFEIIGETITPLAKLDAVLVARISNYRCTSSRLATFSSMVADVDDQLVRDMVRPNFPCFQKKSQKTSGLDLDVARTRLAAVRRARMER